MTEFDGIVIDSGQARTPLIFALAIGQQPNTDVLKIEKTDVLINELGFINVHGHCTTNINGVFALGNCNVKRAFTHTAYNDYQIVENFLFGDESRKILDLIMAYGLFVDPPLGRCGITKAQAISKGINVLEGRRKIKKNAREKKKQKLMVLHPTISELISTSLEKLNPIN